MKTLLKCHLASVLFVAFALAFGSMGFAQNADKVNEVPAGQKMNVEGIILHQQPDGVDMRSLGGATYHVVLSEATTIKEKKSNFLRGARKYSMKDLVPGLRVEVKGVGNSAGALAAREVKLRDDDFIVAQTMDTRVIPVENQLRATQNRLGETEQNAQRLSGQVQELSAVSNAARGGAKAAQETADNAMTAAGNAKNLAEDARTGVRVANDRITSLDDYIVQGSTTVHFKVGSAILSKEDQAELQKFAEGIKGQKGFVVEVAGFASSDGDIDYNRRLSQKRADAVIQFLAENYAIPLRRFVTPMGYGESQPVADNTTRTGRKENRRVEVRILVSKGLTPAEGAAASPAKSETSMLR